MWISFSEHCAAHGMLKDASAQLVFSGTARKFKHDVKKFENQFLKKVLFNDSILRLLT